ncbi:hypothetical protein K4A83_11525 [Spirulina subsalsa FACHB-351]|uniref:DNA methylase n=1 Tax=Spirulina subsalsa FACHB-351 TaxID=234711 RepID=A0ABT3L5U7_9CYAN|nr:hypothetical protein [Spirulina subsalsa]MCW6036888.1 hypothetical protein [Spirulina subsalsa FACHB-351]
MAKSPSHKFGQDLGKLIESIVLEDILKPRLQEFTQANKYYLDTQGYRPARQGKKVTWQDKYGNQHDLDFVIEANGTDDQIGQPVAFIESAWRRYTKHSKNKVQEIQAALLPIIELHQLSAPFYGAVLAGDFTKPALEQLRNNGFAVIFIPYQDVVVAFRKIDFDIAFNEQTSDKIYTQACRKLANLTETNQYLLRQALIEVSKLDIEQFMEKLRNCLERYITQIVVIPLFGTSYNFQSLEDVLTALNQLDLNTPQGKFQKFELRINYSNQDTICATFEEKSKLETFLRMLDS